MLMMQAMTRMPPYGFIGKLQAQSVSRMSSFQVAVVEWLLSQLALHPRRNSTDPGR